MCVPQKILLKGGDKTKYRERLITSSLLKQQPQDMNVDVPVYSQPDKRLLIENKQFLIY